MTDATATTAAAATAATTAAATTTAATTTPPWHNALAPEYIGHWQNKGWKIDDPVEIAINATKQARELEKHFGVPPEQLLKMPKADAKPDEIKAFRMRLGMPAEAKDYDFSTVKDLPQPIADTLRTSAHAQGLSKEAAVAIAADMKKALDAAQATEATVTAAKIAEEQTKLKTDWGPNYEFNKLKAMEGARRLGIAPEAVAALEKQIGYAAVMDAMRKIGVGTSEDNFIERGTGSNGSPTTREGATARKAELMADTAWRDRYLKGDLQAKQEMTALNTMIDGGM
jgi:hypothetical protein